jgi:hypothetical protein
MTVACGIPLWLFAALWGGLVSLGLLLGAFAGLYAPLKRLFLLSEMLTLWQWAGIAGIAALVLGTAMTTRSA